MTYRKPIARLIACLLALAGAPIAILLVGWSFEIGFPQGLMVFVLFLPGWLAFLLLIWTAAGKSVHGDPTTTWLSCILVNAFWLLLFAADTDFDWSTKAWGYFTVRAYALAAVIGGIVALISERSFSSAERYSGTSSETIIDFPPRPR